MQVNETAGLEEQLRNAKEIVARRDLAIKLSGNHTFRKLILEDYFVTEAARLVALSADPALDTTQRADALNMAQAAGHLKRWLSMQVQMGNVAAREVLEVEEALNEIRGAEADEASAKDEGSVD